MSRAYDAAVRVRDAAVLALTTAGLTVPSRVLVQPGSIGQYDEPEALLVMVVRPAVPGGVAAERPRALPQQGPRFCEVRVEVLRCCPAFGEGSDAPDVAEVEAVAELTLADAEALADGLTPLALTGRAGVPAVVGAVQMLGPSGNTAGCGVTVQMPL